MTVYSNPDGITQYGSARIIYKKNNPTEQIFKLSIDSLKILRGTLDGIVPAYEIIDINYDGYKDLLLSFTVNITFHRIWQKLSQVWQKKMCKNILQFDLSLIKVK
jgi:hypothetical protein